MPLFGEIKIFNPKGWGFIRQEKPGPDVYFVKADVKGLAIPGARVSFNISQGRKGLRAAWVRVLSLDDVTDRNWADFISVPPLKDGE